MIAALFATTFTANGQVIPNLEEAVEREENSAEAQSTAAVGSNMISYQGVLENGGGPADGTFSIKFAIYDVETGGTALWSETKSVSVVGGLFSTNLGDASAIDLPFDSPYWLGLTVESDQEATPRTLLTTTPYSYTTGALQGNPVSETAPSSGEVLKWNGNAWAPAVDQAGGGSVWNVSSGTAYYNSGDVAIGTSTPSAKLTVFANSSLTDPHIRLHENGNDYARLNFENNNGSNYWSIAAYIASNNQNDRLNFWNGTSGDVMTITGDGEVGIGVGISPKVPFHIGNGRRVLFGTDTLGNGDKLMFLPDLHAFRVGTVATGAASTYWNRDSIGLYSFASGLNTRAQGFGATAMGRDTEATNSYAFASGFFTNADGQYSTAMGFNTDAFALGSTALGYSTDAEENYSFAAGYFAEAQAIYSIAIGNAVRAQSFASMAVGRYNVGGGSATSWLSSDPIFEIGIGTGPSSRANAMTVRKNGNVGIGTTFPGARLHVTDGEIRIGSLEELSDGGSFIMQVNSTFAPLTNGNRNLGNSSFRWNTVYATNGTINTSDARLKSGITPLAVGTGLSKILRLNPVSYKWKSDPSGDTRYGLLAQDVLEVLPEAVADKEFVYDEETGERSEVDVEYLGINYSQLIPVLISAIKEQQQIIDDLKLRLDTIDRER